MCRSANCRCGAARAFADVLRTPDGCRNSKQAAPKDGSLHSAKDELPLLPHNPRDQILILSEGKNERLENLLLEVHPAK